MDATIRTVIDQQQIRDVIYRYCRGIDRCDYDLVRRCYHPDAVDDHGDFRGGVEDFIAYVQQSLPRFERTMHFIGNVLIEPDGDRARAESYIVAHHRVPESRSKPERDYTVGLRYVDDFEQRDGEWKIAARTCVFEWSRIDPVAPGGWSPVEVAAIGQRDRSDLVYAPTVLR
ncbi:MAG: nuclear transport factor 2 family protein [Acidimicrobiia bacterium]